jgi:hypothetical protein
VVLTFGDHRLDIQRRELRRGVELVGLEPKAFDLLAFLVQHRDRVVSKDDLLQAVWGGRIVSESALITRINAVRRALGDDGATQRLIRTFTPQGRAFRRRGHGTPGPGAADVGQALDRCVAVPKHERRPRAGVFRRRHGRGDHYRAFAVSAAGRDRAQFELHIQGQGGRREAGGEGAGRALRARGLGQEGRQPGAHRRPADQFADRRSYLGRPFRRHARRHLRPAGPGGVERRRCDRAAAAPCRDRPRHPNADREHRGLRPLPARTGARIQKDQRQLGRGGSAVGACARTRSCLCPSHGVDQRLPDLAAISPLDPDLRSRG